MKTARLLAFCMALLICCFYSCTAPYPSDAVMGAPAYKKGATLLGLNNDSAFYYFNQVVNTSKDSLEIATSLNNMAVIQADAGDYFGSQESLMLSLRYLEETKDRDHFCLSSDYNELGNSSLNLRNYDAAIRYYNKALQFSRDDDFNTVVVNNKAMAYQKKLSFQRAIALYDSVLEKSKTDSGQYARIRTNLAMARWLQDSNYRATPALMQSLSIRQALDDKWGLNSSYAHLADYYTHSNKDSALYYATKMNSIARELKSPDDEMESLQKLIILSEGRNAPIYFMRYQHLADSLQTARNNAKNQFALIRYDAEKNMADNLRLQRDNTQKKLQLLVQRVLLYGTLAILIFGSAWAWWWYRKRRQKMLWASEQALREQQIRTSQKVHDVVANGLYRIMSEMEHSPAIDKSRLLDTIETLYEQSRDISYEATSTAATESFDQALASLLASFASPDTKVLVVGNDVLTWAGILPDTKTQLEKIIMELMVNMKKHSQANNVVLKFERQAAEVKMQYIDDGIGLDPGFAHGNGLRNTENRINTMGGRIIFDSGASKGLRIELYIPINRQ